MTPPSTYAHPSTRASVADSSLFVVLGEAAGRKGVWAYIEGGMGKVSSTIAQAAQERGAEIATNASVKRILFDGQKAVGVEMDDGTKYVTQSAKWH